MVGRTVLNPYTSQSIALCEHPAQGRGPDDQGASIGPQGLTSPARRVVRLAATVVAAGATVAMLGSAVAVFRYRVSVAPVLSASMRPAFAEGDAVITRRVPTSRIRPGDVIVFRPPNQTAAYSHRVTSVSGDPARPVLSTKGDANPAPDPWRIRLDGGSVAVVVTSVPEVGRALVAVHGRAARTGLLALAGLVLLVVGTRGILGPRPAARPAPTRRLHAA